MAITKQEALAALDAQDEKDIAAMREMLDAAAKCYDGVNAICVTPWGSRKAREFIAQEYRAAGWTVEFGNDQRDGAWMSLK